MATRASGTGLSTIDNVIRGGELRAHKLGRRTIILRDDLFDWLGSLPLARGPTTTATDLLTALRADEIKNENRSPGYLELERNLGRYATFSREYDFTRLGWASLLFPAHQQQTLTSAQDPALVDPKNVAVCWNREEQQHNNCPDYISPKTHAVLLHLKSAENGKTPPATCTWRLDPDSGAIFATPNTGTTATASCDQDVEIDIPAANKATVSVEPAGQAYVSTTIQVKDLLVVGLGDSFSSGEGNPDVPAKMKWTSSVDRDPLVQNPRDPVSIRAQLHSCSKGRQRLLCRTMD